ncbi:MAG: hypothetical protein BZY82_07285 [SAR202 cluster bacterium Io17-Chloro-G3]|nr:MAG: hypothetical protein BZY82_07285 [SAR202 cluster bacterium Io17-Chloro-G3]
MSKPLRVYPLDPRELSEEQLAVVFAMTSRRPEPFDEIARMVTQEKAADFHERWVLNYGHSSVAEHAVLHIAVENLSRLACDTLEDNRLASYTEKSSRFQIYERGYYHTPDELQGHALRSLFVDTCDSLFESYSSMVDDLRGYLASIRPRQENERDGAYNLRIRREATDTARFILPTATLTNVGITLNARSLEHALRKLLSSDLTEERNLGESLKEQGRTITPTLIKYAERNDYLVHTRKALREGAIAALLKDRWQEKLEQDPNHDNQLANLVYWDPEAEEKVAVALLYHIGNESYSRVLDKVRAMKEAEIQLVIEQALEQLGPHDIPVRELEAVDYTFDFLMDYGAYREFKRHRMQTYIPQALTVEHGYVIPPLVSAAGLEDSFFQAMRNAELAFQKVNFEFPRVAEYLVTHAHKRRVLSKLNLRECYHLFKLRTGPDTHFSLVWVMQAALDAARERHPVLYKHIRLRSDK